MPTLAAMMRGIQPAWSNLESLFMGTPAEAFFRTLDYRTLPPNWWENPEIQNIAHQAYLQYGTDSPFFKAWYGNTPFYWPDGRPQVWYRGSKTQGHTEFDPSRRRPGANIYLADNIETALPYARGDGEIYPMYVQSQRPFIIDGENRLNWRDIGEAIVPQEIINKDPYLQRLDRINRESYAKEYYSTLDKLKKEYSDYPDIVWETMAHYGLDTHPSEIPLTIIDAMRRGNAPAALLEAVALGRGSGGAMAPTEATATWVNALPHYDSLVTKNYTDALKEYYDVYGDTVAVRRPSQVKHTDNIGTFSPYTGNFYKGVVAAPVASALTPEQAYAATGGKPDRPVESTLAYDPVLNPVLAAAGVPGVLSKLAYMLGDLGLAMLLGQGIPDVDERYYREAQ